MSSKSSTKSQLPNKSAWSRGPPPNTAATSATSTPTRSQSPAPQQTHSRRPSTLGQGVSVKDGVSVPRTVKTTATPVTFGSINDASAPISSSPSPAVPPPTAASVKSDVVKSFGSVPAQQPNGTTNASSTAPTTSTAGAAASSSSANPTPPASGAPKLDKKDILKMFQTPGAGSSSSTPPPSTDSPNRSSPAPAVSSQPSTSSTSGSSNPPSFPPSFTPSNARPPQSSSSSQPPRSPVYTRQMPNGNGPRPQQGGPANAAAAGGPASPRLAPPTMQGPGAPTGAPPGPPQMHPGMPPQPMPWGYYPDPNQPYYMPYGWYVPQMPMPGHPGAPPPPGAHHPPHHPHQPHPNQGPPGTPHGPPHALPLSPRAPPPNALPPGTPTTPHASLQHLPHHPSGPHHVPHHGPHGHHSNQGSVSVTSPPGTPASASISITSPSSSSKLNPTSSTFVPGAAGNRLSKISIKNADGSEVDFSAIAKQSRGDASPGPKSATFPRQASPAPTSQNGSLSGTPKRASVRLESEDQRKARLAAEAKEKEEKEAEVRKQKEREEKERKEREAKEEKEREREEKRKKEEEERKEKERKKKEDDEREEQARKKKIEEERERKKKEAEEERERKKIEEAEKAKREEEEKIRRLKEKEEKKKRDEERKKQEEEDRKKREEERKKQEEEDKKRLEAEEKARQEREEEEKKRKAEEEERAKAEAEKKAAEEAAAKAKAEEEAAAKAAEEPEDGEIKETESPVSELPPTSLAKDSKAGLRINTGLDGPRRVRPDPLDLTGAKGPLTGPAPLPSALATARNLESLDSVQYPEGILSPKPELNKNVKDGIGFRYDREFLLQFMKLCTEKPASLPPLHVLGLEPSGDQPSHHMTRTNSGRHGRNASGAMSSRQASIGLGISGSKFGPSSASQPFGTMGNFAGSGASKLSSDDRFAQSQRTVSMGGFSRSTPMTRTGSQGGPGSNRTRSKRGEKRGENNKAPSNLGPGANPTSGLAEPVAPLPVNDNAWKPKRPTAQGADSPEMVDRKVKSLLNKLTMEKFDSISDQIIQWANKSETEKDGRTLIQVIRLVFEKATDEATWSEMYARLCRKMMERISPSVQDDGIKNAEGKPIAGGQLFRKYLLNRCQEDFERGWVNKEATAAAAASKAAQDEAAKQAHDKQGTDEPILYSDEYYAAQKAKRQGLGLIKFIGELFKLQMLTERIMHECVKKLLGNVDNPEEEEIESLCKLLTTVGQSLDTAKARAHMDVYFSRMKELTKSQNVSSRMQFMLQDVIELRERKWVSRQAVAPPSTIAQVHENAAKEKSAIDKDAFTRQISMSRGGSRRGGDRGDHPQIGPDGWAVAGSGPSRAPSKAGDLSNFGKINKSAPMTFGPTSVFAGKNKEGKRDSISRTNSSSNMFSMLQAAEAAEPAAPKAPEPQQRKRLILQPRTVPTEGDAPVPKSPSESSASEDAEVEEDTGGMSEEAAETKIKEDIKEFFAIRSIDEAEVYWTALPAAYHHKLVDSLISQAVESKEADAQLVADLFKSAVSKELCAADAFERGFVNIANMVEDIAIDAPKAVTFFGRVVKAAELDEERRRRLADKASEGHEDEGKEEYAERILKAIS